MRKGKKTILALASALLVFSQAQAAQTVAATYYVPPVGTMESMIVPMWENSDKAIPSICKSGSKIKASLYVNPKSRSASSEGTLYLEAYSRGGWRVVTSWSISGSGKYRENNTYPGEKGVSYRVRADITVESERIQSVSNELTF